jgi:hypothetical protein
LRVRSLNNSHPIIGILQMSVIQPYIGCTDWCPEHLVMIRGIMAILRFIPDEVPGRPAPAIQTAHDLP